jgi:hypothetical protein
MPKDMRELIEKTNIDSKLKISWNKIFKQLSDTSELDTVIFHFSKSILRAGINNKELEKKRKEFRKVADELTEIMHDIVYGYLEKRSNI